MYYNKLKCLKWKHVQYDEISGPVVFPSFWLYALVYQKNLLNWYVAGMQLYTLLNLQSQSCIWWSFENYQVYAIGRFVTQVFVHKWQWLFQIFFS